MENDFSIKKIEITNPIARYDEPIMMHVELCCPRDLTDELKWIAIYQTVSGDNQVSFRADEISIGPIKKGMNEFTWQINPPNINRIPLDLLLGPAILKVECKYRDQFLFKCKFVANIEYKIPLVLKDDDSPVDPLAGSFTTDVTYFLKTNNVKLIRRQFGSQNYLEYYTKDFSKLI